MLQPSTIEGGPAAVYPCLEDRHILITGGATGIGEALVTAFAHQGARVKFLDIQEAPAEALIERLASISKHTPEFKKCDLRDIAQVNDCVNKIASSGGAFDVLLNNAANDDRHELPDVSPEYWDDRMAVNLRHQFFMTKAVVPGMKDRGRGSIINFGSISWHLGLENLVAYQTAKAAIEGMTRALARELGPDGIRVNAIIPGNVETERQKKWYTPEGEAEILAAQCLKQRIQPSDIAAMALFLASDDARMCTAHNYWVDAGWR